MNCIRMCAASPGRPVLISVRTQNANANANAWQSCWFWTDEHENVVLLLMLPIAGMRKVNAMALLSDGKVSGIISTYSSMYAM